MDIASKSFWDWRFLPKNKVMSSDTILGLPSQKSGGVRKLPPQLTDWYSRQM